MKLKLKKYSIYLITNKHVVERRNSICIQLNSPTGIQVITIPLVTKTLINYSGHPNANVDVIACRIDINGAIATGAEVRFFELDEESLTLEQMKKNDVREGSLVFALGFPMSVSEDIVMNNYKAPVCRLGCISRVEHTYHSEEANNYIVDAPTFPGNSGGPVVFKTEDNSNTSLIGIMSGYLPYTENLVITQTGRLRSKYQGNSGLTIVFPVDSIVEVIEIERTRSTGLQPNQIIPGLK